MRADVRRWARRALLGLGGLVGGLLLLVCASLAYLSSPPGEAWLRDRALALVNGTFEGKWNVERLGLSFTELTFEGVTLTTPEDAPILRAERLKVAVDLDALLVRKIRLKTVSLDGPALVLRQDAHGLNLLRALERSEPSPKADASERSSFVIQVDALSMRDGSVEYIDSRGEKAHRVHADALALRGSVLFNGGDGSLRAVADLEGQLRAPLQRPLKLNAAVDGTVTAPSGSVKLEMGGLRLAAKGDRTPGGHHLVLEEAVLPSGELRALVPGYPLLADVSLQGTATQQGAQTELNLTGEAGKARLHAEGKVDLASLEASGVRVTLGGVNLSELLEGGPQSQLSLELVADGGGRSLETLQGRATLHVPASTLEGQPVGPVHAELTAGGGELRVEGLSARLPGVTLEAKGTLTRERVGLTGTLVAQDLRRLGRSLKGLAPGVKLAGSGKLTFRATGSLERPSLALDGRFPSLRWAEHSVQQLRVDARIPNIRRPLDSNGRLSLGRVLLGGRELRNVLAEIRTHGRALNIALSSQGMAEVSLVADGTLDGDAQGFALANLSVRLPDASWTLEKPAHLRFSDSLLEIQPLSLRAGNQALNLRLRATPRHLDGAVQLVGLDLSRLPRFLLPAGEKTGGTLFVSVTAKGARSRPHFDGRVRLEKGAFAQLTGLGLELEGGFDGRRLRAAGRGRGLEGAFRLDADLPLDALARRAPEPVRLELATDILPLGPMLEAAGIQTRGEGDLGLRLSLTGNARAPLLRLTVTGQKLIVGEAPPVDGALSLEGAAEGPLRLNMHAHSTAGKVLVTANTKSSWVRLWTQPPETAAQARALPLETEVRLEALALETLAKLGLVPAQTGGRLSAVAKLHGSALHPLGTLKAELRGFRSASDLTPLDASLVTTLSPEAVSAELSGQREGSSIALVRARLGAPLSALSSRTVLETAPLELTGQWGPLSLADFQPPSEDRRGRVMGQASGTLQADGTLKAPRLRLETRVEKLGVGKLAVGQVRMRYDYRDALSTLSATLTSAGGGKMQVAGTVKQDLSLPVLQKGVPLGKAPVQARLESQGFDLAFLSGITPMVQSLGGRLDANAELRGTLRMPKVRGRVEWQNGALGLLGYGRYDGIQMRLLGSETALTLEELRARSLEGSLRLTARAQRHGDRFTLKGTGRLDRFPIMQEDQLRATVSLRTEFQGEATESLVAIRNLTIPEAHIQLPEVRSKDLQSLDRPDDIVIVRNGVPLYRQKGGSPSRADAKPKGAPGATPPASPSSGAPSRRILILVDAPRNVWVKGTDVNLELGLSDDFRVEIAEETQLSGTVSVRHGTVETLGRSFSVQRNSTVRFTGPPQTPYLNLTAEYVNAREEITVFLNIRGQGTNVTVKPTSKPPLTDSEIYTLLATGRRQLREGGGTSIDTSQAMSLVGSLAADQVKKILSDKLPLDVFSIEAGQGAGMGPRVEFGTYVGDKMYLGGSYQGGTDPLKGENSSSARLEYQLTPRLGVEVEAGDAGAGSADIIWSRDY